MPPPRPCDGMYLFLPHHPLCLPHTHTHTTPFCCRSQNPPFDQQSHCYTHTLALKYILITLVRGTAQKKPGTGNWHPCEAAPAPGPAERYLVPTAHYQVVVLTNHQNLISHIRCMIPYTTPPVIPYPHHATLGLFTPRASPVVERTYKTKG